MSGHPGVRYVLIVKLGPYVYPILLFFNVFGVAVVCCRVLGCFFTHHLFPRFAGVRQELH